MDESRNALSDHRSVVALRCVLAALIAAHGWYRLTTGGIALFGAWLDSQGWPLSGAIATAVTLLEVFGTPLLVFGRFQFLLSLCYASIYTVGLVIVHLPFGWYVVGPGRNGMEYSVLLISAFLILAYQSRPLSLRAD